MVIPPVVRYPRTAAMPFISTFAVRRNLGQGRAYGKRKASQSGPAWKRAKPMPAAARGYMRTSGYYGRYSAASGGESKFFDVTLDDAVVATAGGLTDSINKIAQGTTESERDGRKCTVTSVHWKYEISLPEIDALATANSSDAVRVIMYVDKQANGATAAVTDLLETANYQSFYNLANQQRFRILTDVVHQINYKTLASDGAGLVSSAQVLQEYRKSCAVRLPLEFSATTGAITEIRSNNIGVLLISRNGIAGFNSELRVRFSG